MHIKHVLHCLCRIAPIHNIDLLAYLEFLGLLCSSPGVRVRAHHMCLTSLG